MPARMNIQNNPPFRIARHNGCAALEVAEGSSGFLDRAALATLENFYVVALWSDTADQSAARQALASRDGALIPLVCGDDLAERCRMERHICVDTTAAGGNAQLLASVEV